MSTDSVEALKWFEFALLLDPTGDQFMRDDLFKALKLNETYSAKKAAQTLFEDHERDLREHGRNMVLVSPAVDKNLSESEYELAQQATANFFVKTEHWWTGKKTAYVSE